MGQRLCRQRGLYGRQVGAASTLPIGWLRAKHIKIFTDGHVKHGAHAIMADRTLEELTRDLDFFDADVVIATGQRTGDSARLDELATVAAPRPACHGGQRRQRGQHRGDLRPRRRGHRQRLEARRRWWNAVDPQRLASFMAVVREARG